MEPMAPYHIRWWQFWLMNNRYLGRWSRRRWLRNLERWVERQELMVRVGKAALQHYHYQMARHPSLPFGPAPEVRGDE